ncbi:CapA family protein [Planococcus lenghuensis]|uniref:Capsular biosynthesis protein n=1 Tax=Planococcus lenghuensis TaxID=2213202 RepID=A0A1Q2KW35_9BACL|nr:CapA family protein [Planococcus lenghuensis]AQQ52353.1 capsular biosynthesis protein [Planococcus lenghuensis]
MKKVRVSLGVLLLPLSLLSAGCTFQEAETVIEAAPFSVRALPIATVPEKVIKTREVTLAAVGDVLIHDRVYNDAETESGYNFNPKLEEVKPYLEQADITIANSESIVGGSEIGLSGYPSFNSPYEVADTMKNVGVDVVAMANNHTLDRGIQAVENAINYWHQLGIKHTGSALTEEAGRDIPTVTANDITFSFLSYTYGTNGVQTPAGQEYLVNRIDRARIQEDLKRAQELSDVVVLNLHFGKEYERMPNAEQIDLAHFAAENGADIILGHHPHVLQPADWIETSDGGETFVIYSLGNFFSGQDGLYKQTGGILHLTVEKVTDAASETITITEPAFTPTFVTSENEQNYQMELLKNVDPAFNEEIKEHMSMWVPEMMFIE